MIEQNARRILREIEARLLERSIRGTFYLRELSGCMYRLDWASAWGSRAAVQHEALATAVSALRGAGYRATTIPGLPWAQVELLPTDVIDADAPKTAEDGGESDPQQREHEPHNYQCAACGSRVASWRAPALRDGRPVCGDCASRPKLTKETAFHGL
jgi:hypothetical protein